MEESDTNQENTTSAEDTTVTASEETVITAPEETVLTASDNNPGGKEISYSACVSNPWVPKVVLFQISGGKYNLKIKIECKMLVIFF